MSTLPKILGRLARTRLGSLAPSTRVVPRSVPSVTLQPVRWAGGGEIHEVPNPNVQDEEHTMFGIPLGSYKKEGWEELTFFWYTSSFIIIVFGWGNRPNTTIRDWAHEEAYARRKIEENGGEWEYGVHYKVPPKYHYVKDEDDDKPKLRRNWQEERPYHPKI